MKAKKTLSAAGCLMIVFVTIADAIPSDRKLDLEEAVIRVALDVTYEDPSTPSHAERLALANEVTARPNWELAQHIGKTAEANSSYETPINWETVTRAELRVMISGVWTIVAESRHPQ